ncbi:hypothetical protein EUX98_g841 [Antrodiella citrinella]|uniref:Uncharacterized protein n=1 Tax=Antrodiella citrinella TaxID=2447956 RepID=A0A4S4N2X5_9APHY|nr:hypothetical protein EUX98_g841 [Antrodiella citrinella]
MALSSPAPGTLESSLESVDIKEIIAATHSDGYSIVSNSISLSSASTSLYSLGDTPPFDSITAARAPSIRFTAMSILSTADPRSSWLFKPTVIIPTPKRVKSMLMEPICVDKWAERTDLHAPPGHRPWEDTVTDCDAFPRPPWVPEGSMFSPEALRAILHHRRTTLLDSNINDDSSLLANILYPSNDVSSQSINGCGDIRTHAAVDDSDQKHQDFPSADQVSDVTPLDMPSIMVSTSTAVVPISLESSQCLLPPAPLAIRRGKDLPAPLNLTVPGSYPPTSDRDNGEKPDTGLYPGIPTPFLGTAKYNATFEYPVDDVAISMDLGTMCGNLRSICPPLRTPDVFPPLPPLPTEGDPYDPAVEIPFAEGSDEWDVLEGFLDDVVELPFPEKDLQSIPGKTQPLVPLQRATASKTLEDSVSWDNSVTLDTVSSPEPAPEVESSKSDAASKRQSRRRTVIIETPGSTERRRTRVTLDLSDLASCEDLVEEPTPIPWEPSPPSHFSFSPQSFAQSTPHSRPASSATMKPPARGILKVQKNVRFSIIPDMHEYEDDNSVDADATLATLEHERSPTPPPGGRRNSKVLSDPADLVTAASDKKNRASFPRHPVARSIAKRAKAASTSPPAKSTVPVPALVTPKTPKTPPAGVRRNPLRAVNAHKSLPATAVTSPSAKDARGSAGVIKEEIRKPKRLRAALSMQPEKENRRLSVAPTVQEARSSIAVAGKNGAHASGRMSAITPPKKMHVPFRSMWSKLRA